eukprot:11426278-Karenia_brevis.AAC.1
MIKTLQWSKDWSDGEDRFDPPKCVQDLDETTIGELIELINDTKIDQAAKTAFPAEMRAEEEFEEREDGREEFFDAVVDDEDMGDESEEVLVQEREMLEEVPLPGNTTDEAKRKSEWLKLPRAARAAIRRLHN